MSRLNDGADLMKHVIPGLCIENAPGRNAFQMKLARAAIGDLHLVASTTTACRWVIDRVNGWSLVVPTSGALEIAGDGRTFRTSAGKGAMILPEIARVTDRTGGATVRVNFNPDRLNRTCAALSGEDPGKDWLGQQVHSLQLDAVRGSFGVFEHACGLVDVASRQPGLAEGLGIDDLLYRWIALGLMAVSDPILVSDRLDPRTVRLDVLCDMIRSSADRPLTSTEMELETGLSRRALQVAFAARFGCSPMEWQRRERIARAQTRLLAAGPDQTITQIAHAMGYSSSATFATLYRRYFKETPSQTLARRG